MLWLCASSVNRAFSRLQYMKGFVMKANFLIVASTILCVLFLVLHHNIVSADGRDRGHAHHFNVSSVPDEKPSVTLSFKPQEIQTDIPVILSFSIADKNGKPIKNLSISHERILHVVIISRDLRVFDHLHPEDFGPISNDIREHGRYDVRYVFPKAGEYLIAVDFAVGHKHFSDQFIVEVVGEKGMGQVQFDFTKEKDFGTYHVLLHTEPEHVKEGQKTKLIFKISKGGKKVTDIEPYLAAPMHLAVVHSDLKTFIHAHGVKPGNEPEEHGISHIHGMVQDSLGPEIVSSVRFPSSGIYKIFGEMKHEGKIILLEFMINVEK